MLEIDGYHIFAELKRGPLTTIYKALDTKHGRIVLIKLLHADAAAETNWLAQFLLESNINALMVHPNLRHIYHSGMVGDEHFLALEYVEGPTLAELIQQHKKLPLDICLFIAKELARAIAAVHRYNVLHLDIKPPNIFISFSGEVKLGDLGFAREQIDTNPLITGTPAYMSPEQVLGREIAKASDLFSFGAVFYEMLTGESAFANQTLSGTLHHVANWEPMPIVKLRPEVPAEFVGLCQKLLAKNPAERHNEVEAVLDHFSQLEYLYGLTTTRHHLVDFLTSPQTYHPAELQRNEAAVELPPPEANNYSRTPSMSWGLAAVVSAAMFLGGVLFINVLKTRVESKTLVTASANPMVAPMNGSPKLEIGYLDLRATPGAVVTIDAEVLGKTPLSRTIGLPTGLHQVRLQHPRWGTEMFEVQISAGDTLYQLIDLTKP